VSLFQSRFLPEKSCPLAVLLPHAANMEHCRPFVGSTLGNCLESISATVELNSLKHNEKYISGETDHLVDGGSSSSI